MAKRKRHPTNPNNVTKYRKMLTVVDEFTAETSKLINLHHYSPAPGSIAESESNYFPNREHVESAYSIGIISMEVAADHLMAFTDLLQEPVKTIAPWTCVRSLLESCALATWLLDFTIDVKERVCRCFAFRYHGLVQQKKIYQLDGGLSNEASLINQRISKVEQDAQKLGFSPIRNNVGKIGGIGKIMPEITRLIKITLNREKEYRLLSAVAHGHYWAIQQVGFYVVEVPNGNDSLVKGLKKHLEPTYMLYLAKIAMTSFAQVLWCIWRIYGWNEEEIKSFLEATFDQLEYSNDCRPWHT